MFKPNNSQENRGWLLQVKSKEIQQMLECLQHSSPCLVECPVGLCYTPDENRGQSRHWYFQVSDFIRLPFCVVLAH